MFYQIIKPFLKNTSQKEVKRNEIIYHEGDTPDSLYFIEKGLVGLFHLSESGKETFFRVFGENDILGHRSYFAEESYHASAVALSCVTLVTITKQECQRICEEHPELLKNITKIMARDLGKSELRMAGLLDKTANKRVSESLVFLKLKYPDYTWTRKEIGEFSGSTFETVTRVMTKLEKEGLIIKQGRDFEIPDHQKLLGYSEKNFS